MEGDDGAIEKELAGAVGDNGCINGCVPGNHAFPRLRRPTPLHPSWNGCFGKSPEKTCETQCEGRNSALGARRPPAAPIERRERGRYGLVASCCSSGLHCRC